VRHQFRRKPLSDFALDATFGTDRVMVSCRRSHFVGVPKCQNGRFAAFALFNLLLAFSSFCLPLCFAFGLSLATLPLFSFSLPGIHFVDLLFGRRRRFFHRLHLLWRLRCGVNMLRWLRRLRCLCVGG
jgi:hypothetical protein